MKHTGIYSCVQVYSVHLIYTLLLPVDRKGARTSRIVVFTLIVIPHPLLYFFVSFTLPLSRRCHGLVLANGLVN